MARKSDETAALTAGYSRLTMETGPKLSADYPNYLNVEQAVEEIPGRDVGGPGFLERQNTFERI